MSATQLPPPPPSQQQTSTTRKAPRVVITYCTQCKWLLRAAYYAQELLSTFSLSLGEVALVPGTGGVFTVHLQREGLPSHNSSASPSAVDKPGKGTSSDGEEVLLLLLWDFKTERSFPETKVLKQLVRDHVDPERKLGHSDTPSNRKTVETKPESTLKQEEN